MNGLLYLPKERKFPKRNCEAWSDVSFAPGFFVYLRFDLHTQHISHRLRGFFLCRCGHMGVSIQGETCGEVAEHAADGLDVDAVLQGQGGESVAEVVESDLRDACPCQNTLQHIVHAVRRNRATALQGFSEMIFCATAKSMADEIT